jgi:hypothetical protein
MFVQTYTLPKHFERIRIVFVSDLHIGLKGFREDIFDKILDELKDPNTYWIGGGDYIEGRNPSAKFFDYDENTMSVQEQYDYFFAKVQPYLDRCLGLHVGNHERALIKDTTVDPLKSFCLIHKIPYLGGTAITTLSYGRFKYRICTLHGAGGGAKVGSNLNKLTDYLANFDADAVVCGHYHRLALNYALKPYTDDLGKHRWRNVSVILSGSCLDGYRDDGVGYAEVNMYPPTILGYATIDLDNELNPNVVLKPFV